jgi:hypothetical protein
MLACLLTVAAAAKNHHPGYEQRYLQAGPCSSRTREGATSRGPTCVRRNKNNGRHHHQAATGAHRQLRTRPNPPMPPESLPSIRLSPVRTGENLYSCHQKYRRQISSATDLRFLHIPREMAGALIPDVMAYQINRPGRKKAPVRLDSSEWPVFAARVSIIDQDGHTWPILLRTYVAGKQYHRRLTAGWAHFAAHHSLTAGDSVHFWRTVEDECADALVMRAQVVRGILR